VLHLDLPSGLDHLIRVLREAGGRPFVVGGAVRDALLGQPLKDYDLEVFGLEPERLKGLLASNASVNAVGEAFTVFKVSGLEGVDGAVDVSIPRRDSKAGPGHRGIVALGDPQLSVEEASRRRDPGGGR
jgi:tRNA nucleotidyltransferase (CCA-adding enzyme)